PRPRTAATARHPRQLPSRGRGIFRQTRQGKRMPRNQSFCSVALAAIAGLVLIGVFVWQRPTNPAEWAAWMQALGSIVAVGVAIWVPYKQRENQRRDEAVKLRGDKLDRLHLAEGAIQC